jgi:predicted secreted protein
VVGFARQSAADLPGFLGMVVTQSVQRLWRSPSGCRSCSAPPSSARSATPTGPIGVVGVGRISGEVFAIEDFTTTEKLSYFLQLLASVNLVLFLFNLLPIYPLDGGHVAGALYEKARSVVARLRGPARPRPVRHRPADARSPTSSPGCSSPCRGCCSSPTSSTRSHCSRTRHRPARNGDTRGHGHLRRSRHARAAPARPRPPPQTRQLDVGGVGRRQRLPVSVQSMTTTKTADINATLQQIAELTASGCQIVRVAVPDTDDAEALPIIAEKSQIPVIADIHFQPRYVFAAIDAGCAAVRVNPGQHQEVRRQGRRDRPGGQGRRHPDPDRVNAGR